MIWKANQNPRTVRWNDGSTERVDLSVATAGFAGLKVGQWFEAIVERLPSTGRIQNIPFINRVPESKVVSTGSVKALWNDLKAASIEDCNEDFTRR